MSSIEQDFDYLDYTPANERKEGEPQLLACHYAPVIRHFSRNPTEDRAKLERVASEDSTKDLHGVHIPADYLVREVPISPGFSIVKLDVMGNSNKADALRTVTTQQLGSHPLVTSLELRLGFQNADEVQQFLLSRGLQAEDFKKLTQMHSVKGRYGYAPTMDILLFSSKIEPLEVDMMVSMRDPYSLSNNPATQRRLDEYAAQASGVSSLSPPQIPLADYAGKPYYEMVSDIYGGPN